jgi:hypothetical protein
MDKEARGDEVRTSGGVYYTAMHSSVSSGSMWRVRKTERQAR